MDGRVKLSLILWTGCAVFGLLLSFLVHISLLCEFLWSHSVD